MSQTASPDEIRRSWRSLVLLVRGSPQPCLPPSRARPLPADPTPARPQYHPDKRSGEETEGGPEREERLLAVNRAWEVLRDPLSREGYDHSLLHHPSATGSTSSSSGRLRTKARPPPPLARTVLSLDLFTPHYARRSSDDVQPVDGAQDGSDADDEDDEPTHYTHSCRCSALYTITTAQLEDGVDVIGCDGCGDWVRVGYEVLEESEAE